MAGCNHDWKPIKKWTARYRCTKCHAYGYRKAAISEDHRKPTIAPYICKGFKCKRPAQIISKRQDIQLCFDHYRQRKAKEREKKAKQDAAWQALQEKTQAS